MNTLRHVQRPAGACGGLLAWLAVAVFLLQLCIAGQHNHEGTAKASHCPACVLSEPSYPEPPDAAEPGASAGWNLVAILDMASLAESFAAEPSHILPYANAPPSGFLPH